MVSNVLLLILVMSLHSRYSKKLKLISIENIQFKKDLHGLCHGAVNVDRHFGEIDKKIKRVLERQEKYDSSDFIKREYDHAIRSIKNGASMDHLVNVYGLSHAEARLLVSLHAETSNA